MSVSDANLLQTKTGTVSGSNTVITSLNSGTTAESTVIVVIATSLGTWSGITLPSGFITDKTQGSSGGVAIFHKPDVFAGETSWTFTLSASTTSSWTAYEYSNIDPVEPVDVSVATQTSSVANGGTASTGTTSINAGLSVVAIAAFAAPTVGQTESFSGYTNSFTEDTDQGSTTNPQLATATKYVDNTTGTFETTATFATTSGTARTIQALLVVYRAADAPIQSPLAMFTGFEFGTSGGIGNLGAQSPMNTNNDICTTGTWNTNYLVQAGSARNGNYGLRISNSSSVGSIGVSGASTGASGCFGVNARVVSATGTVMVGGFGWNGTDTLLTVLYDSSATKFGVRWGASGTPSWQSGTTALNTWVWIDGRVRWDKTTWHLDWRIETGTDTYTAQTSPADLTGQTIPAIYIGTIVFGSYSASQSMVADFDDPVSSRYWAAYPLGPHKIPPVIVPDTTGASVSGTAANFNEFTANGTLAAFASTSGQRIDEVPPTVSASADGVVQVTAASSDYMNFLMGTYACAADEMVAAVRMVAAAWGGTGTGTGTLGIRGHDGTTEATIIAALTSYDAASPTAVSSAAPIWQQGMWLRSNGWSQSALDAAALRVGFSTDATPDMGVSALYLEVAVKKASTVRQITLEDPLSATADLIMNTDTSASVAYVVTNSDSNRTVNFTYSVAGTPQAPVPVGPGTNQTVTVNADNFGDVSDLNLEPL